MYHSSDQNLQTRTNVVEMSSYGLWGSSDSFQRLLQGKGKGATKGLDWDESLLPPEDEEEDVEAGR